MERPQRPRSPLDGDAGKGKGKGKGPSFPEYWSLMTEGEFNRFRRPPSFMHDKRFGCETAFADVVTLETAPPASTKPHHSGGDKGGAFGDHDVGGKGGTFGDHDGGGKGGKGPKGPKGRTTFGDHHDGGGKGSSAALAAAVVAEIFSATTAASWATWPVESLSVLR
ncbi:unnamed protein product [Prorocentrum cordatum]|uniref:Uncharacterized protein n=1 Tax=Prorocentrum cordatum TaxID=2364126 RepID=A0ABN9X914_9DINO|nr:unnamed protein product [Polarella glacialis]|mmetsp:Transcript_9063/g.24670  ORF Transcript_9063/g.24670 Transcript_9063/m.24670 type:complete len:166 (-) Transcript_9063:163-660(-)